MLKKISYLFFIFFSILFYSSSSFCDEATKKECMDKVEEVSQIITEQGIRKAAEAVMATKSEYLWKDSYVFIIHIEGLCIAHPAMPQIVGKNVFNLKDEDKKYFIKDLIESAIEKGACWTDYKWPRPQSKKSIVKLTYVKKNGDFVIGAGMYIE